MSVNVTAMPSDHEPQSDAHEQRALGFWLYLMGDAVIFGLLLVGNMALTTNDQLFFLVVYSVAALFLLIRKMTTDKVLRMKPQNLLTGLPARFPVSLT